MTIKAYRLLKIIKKAQINESKEVFIDFNERYVCTVSEKNDSKVTIDISEYEQSLLNTLEYLIDSGLIEKNYSSSSYVKVTHLGWHFGEITLWKIFSFLMKSIIVPIFVAFITAILTITLSR